MKEKILKLCLIVTLVMLVGAPLSWASETAHGYVIAYSFRDKSVYHTPVLTQEVSGKSFSDEEYVSDTKLILKMEDAFQQYLKSKLKVRSYDLTVSARPAFKTEQIAKEKMDKEVGNFRFKGFKITKVDGFEIED